MADTNSCRPLPQMMPQTVFRAIDSRLSSPADNPLRPSIPDDNPGHYFALPCFVVRFVGHGSISPARWDRRSRRVSRPLNLRRLKALYPAGERVTINQQTL